MEWSGGQWSNENILQLIELYKQEPCLWDPRTRNYKNRCVHAGAWSRILSKLPFKTTLDEVKKKKNSLMGYYRIHLNRYKKCLSINDGRGSYKTTWFAFDLMHSFLSPIYVGPYLEEDTMSPASTTGEFEMQVVVKAEPRSGSDSENGDETYLDDQRLEINSEIKEEPSLKTALYPEVNEDEDNAFCPVVSINEGDPITRGASSNVNESNIENNECRDKFKKSKVVKRVMHEEMDEYDHFGFMIASKIRKISDTTEKEILMNSIQNLVFETFMKCCENNSKGS